MAIGEGPGPLKLAIVLAVASVAALTLTVGWRGGGGSTRTALFQRPPSFLEDRRYLAPPGGYVYRRELPPSSWPENFDGRNFVMIDREEPAMDAEFWQAVAANTPVEDYDSMDDLSEPSEEPTSWNTNVWCPYAICDYTSESPEDFEIAEYSPAVPWMQ
ncbi:hypothetical protein GUITHDRAFT_147904 [Guillardia theta CCMP2712]|uniref:Uncharacterized protein n=1 Tax=Guillardia theta (strain CCMP2712) TaxID=905079 RepID=L1IB21_GUITC|nr:hypothetical protein GUITHDRAFT_147904 [Guillardia theta CCMP2712]EKX33456.1 hypothetical protein GUITHDRAFT_147904 [Guillardia theta CCMP2712]|eukprot:XP_005820436.1 hypothetical protein GUITHDRAFT_147904 [Guillardia theta CCMP2712]